MHRAEDAVIELPRAGLRALQLDEGLHPLTEQGDLVDDRGKGKTDGRIGVDLYPLTSRRTFRGPGFWEGRRTGIRVSTDSSEV